MKSRDEPTAKTVSSRVAQWARMPEIPRIDGTERCIVSVVKVVELIGVSTVSWEDATKQAVKDASKTIKNITGVQVIGATAKTRDGEIIEYRATVKVAFGLTDR